MEDFLVKSYSINLAAADKIANAAISGVSDLSTHKPMYVLFCLDDNVCCLLAAACLFFLNWLIIGDNFLSRYLYYFSLYLICRSVTVLDSKGGILVQKRMDGCPDGAYMKFSYAKARTCIHLQCSSRTFREKYTGEGEAAKFTQAASMVTLMQDELVPVAGGVPIKGAGMLCSFHMSST